jgi:hypothetical protein
LHDGSAKTLRDVLTTRNKGDKHGKTSHLKAGEIDDLVEFLKALPYEKPPDDTPNTVKYRLKNSTTKDTKDTKGRKKPDKQGGKTQ